MASIKIDSSSITVEQGIEWLDDGTEEFDLGTFLIKNTTRRTPYPDYADIEITIGTETIEGCIKKDLVKRVSNGTTPKYEHTITIAETVIKLSQYPHPDRLFTTKSGSKTTYKIHAQELVQSAFFGKTAPLTFATATLTELDADADEKEYTGGDLLKSLVDCFRSRGLIPTLSLTNEIGHKDIRQLGNEISFTRIDGEIIDSDINDYAMKVYTKVKKGTYEADLIAGGTYFPDKTTGVTVRSITEGNKYSDGDAGFILDSGIRRMIDVRAKNITTSTLGTLTNVLLNIVSKEEWDELTTNREYNNATPSLSVYAGDYQNNTLYFIEGDNKIYNCGTEYEYNGILLGQPKDALSQCIRRALYKQYATDSEYVPQNISDIEVTFYYQPIRDLDVVQERHEISRVIKNTAFTNQQKDSKLELARFGKSNKQLINRMGNDTYQITVRYYDKDTPTLFSVGDYTSDGYRIIKRQFLLRNDSQDVTYLVTKNQSILNPITSVKRNFTSPFTISKRNILTNFVYEGWCEFSATNRSDELNEQNLDLIIMNALNFSSTYDTPLYTAQYRRGGASDYINLSIQKLAMGNSFQFNAQFNHPKFAGYQLTSDVVGQKLKPISYGDANGEVDTASITFANSTTFNVDDYPVATFNTSWILRPPSLATYGLNPDEILGITYSLHCYSDNPDLFIGDYFLSNNSLVKELSLAQGITISYYNDNPNYTINDDVLKGTPDGTGSYVLTGSSKYFDITVPAGSSWVMHKSTAPYNIYFAYNNRGTDLTRVYRNFRNSRTGTETL